MPAAVSSPSKRSPLRRAPLRQAGQSVEDMRLARVDDAVGYLIGPGFLLLLAALEWWRTWRKDGFHPWFYSVIALVALAFGFWKVRAIRRELQDIREGRDGERLVAERLEELRAQGFHPLHDIVAGSFNLDHILIGPTGLFVIETKTLRKRGGPEEKIEFDGQQLRIRGQPLPRDPVAQARANAGWLREFLRESTGRTFPVTPVVMLPGWYVAARIPMREMLVLNDHPNGLQAYLIDQKVQLTQEDIALIRTHLALFVRASAPLPRC